MLPRMTLWLKTQRYWRVAPNDPLTQKHDVTHGVPQMILWLTNVMLLMRDA